MNAQIKAKLHLSTFTNNSYLWLNANNRTKDASTKCSKDSFQMHVGLVKIVLNIYDR